MMKSKLTCLLLLVTLVSAALVHSANELTFTEGVASWYGEKYRGRMTASGSIFNPDELTAAHRTLPFGTVVYCRYGTNTVRVVITDRGPFVKGRIIDLSRAAFSRLAHTDAGLIKIKLTIINK